jgi:hypothetical protein
MEAMISVRRAFGADLGQANPLDQSQHATPFPIQHLMNNFRVGSTLAGSTAGSEDETN